MNPKDEGQVEEEKVEETKEEEAPAALGIHVGEEIETKHGLV